MRIHDRIERRAIDALVPYARNARTHSDEQVAQIAASLREFGFTNPVLIDEAGGIVAGHGRILAAQRLGMNAVPCIVLEGLTEAQRRAYVIADNQIAMNAGWDDALLRAEIADLQAMDYDLDMLGFGDEEIADLLAEMPQESTKDPDVTPPVQANPVSRCGDVWLLGRHRVMCGDSTDPEHVRRLMAGRIAHLLHADPPYGMGKAADGVANDNLYGHKLDAFHMCWWRAVRPHLAENASAYIWGNAPGLWRLWYRGGLADSEKITFRNEIVWVKTTISDAVNARGKKSGDLRSYPPATERCIFFMLGEQGFSNNAEDFWEGWEPIRAYLESEMKKCGWKRSDIDRITGTQMAKQWVTKSQWALITADHYAKIQAAARDHDAFRRDHDALKRDHDALKRDHDALKRDFYATRAYFDNAHDSMTDVWLFASVKGEDRHGHATPKPVSMMERVMISSLPDGGLCVEPFGGSGSTLMAAERTGRACYAMELQGIYCDVMVNRWQDYTGHAATLEGDGRTFEAITAERFGDIAKEKGQ